jgi:hypothetical protein
MRLLELSSDLVSLEFGTAEVAAVKARLGRLGMVTIARRATYDLITVAGEEFLFQNEWDEPCLIARSPAGSALLRFVAVADAPPQHLVG